MKRIGIFLIAIMMIFTVTACGSSNNMTCSGKYSLIMDVYLMKSYSASVDGSSSDTSVSSIMFNEADPYIENGDYEFIYDGDELVGIKGTELFSEQLQSQITDEQIESLNAEGRMKITKESNGKYTVEYELDENDDYVKAFNKEEDLRKTIEKSTSLSCSGTFHVKTKIDN